MFRPFFRRPTNVIVFSLFAVGVVFVWFSFSFGGRVGLFAQPAKAQIASDPMPTLDEPIIARVYGPDGQETDLKPTFVIANNKLRISMPSPGPKFHPGRYRMRVWMLRNGAVYYTENDFTWGVLAVNVDKSIYTIGDTGWLQLGVLDDSGHTICDADLDVTITGPNGIVRTLTTADETIMRMPSCGPDNVTSEPDYSGRFSVDVEGVYQLAVKATTENGVRDFEDSFHAQAPPAFDVERIGPTRIYPVASYRMTIRVRATHAFAGEIRETVPSDFFVTSDVGSVPVSDSAQALIWNRVLAAGETTELTYIFKAPQISPELYRLGPLAFGPPGNDFVPAWQEARQWQIASDAVTSTGHTFWGSTSTAGALFFATLNGLTMGGAVSGPTSTASQMAFVRAYHAPTRDEQMVGWSLLNGTLNAATCVGGCDASGDASVAFTKTALTAALTCDATFGSCWRPFDIAYEQLSGRAMVAFASTSNDGTLLYCLWDGNAWTPSGCAAPSALTLASGAALDARWIRLVARGEKLKNARSNEILMTYSYGNAGTSTIMAGIWNGSAWANTTTITVLGSTAHLQVFDAQWEETTGNALVFWSEGTTATTTPFRYKRWIRSTGSWDTTGASPAALASTTIGHNVYMNGSPVETKDHIGIVASAATSTGSTCVNAIASACKIYPFIWPGGTSPTATVGNIWQSSEPMWQPIASVAAEANNSQTEFIYTGAVGSGNASSAYQTWIEGTGFGAITYTGSTLGDDPASLVLTSHPNTSEIWLTSEDIDADCNQNRWTGSAWSGWDITACSSGSATDLPPRNTNNAQVNEGLALWVSPIPYSPWSLNWRWTGDTSNDTPGSWSAAENVSSTNVATGTTVRLRWNFAERAGLAQQNGRKRLQYTTSSDPEATSSIWSFIGESASSTVIRFANCTAGADGGAVATTTLASSTQVGLFLEQGYSNVTSTHGSLGIIEHDYCLQTNAAPTGTLFYFRAYDNDQRTVVYRQQTSWPSGPCAAGAACTYPSFLTKTGLNSAPTVSNVVVNGGSAITPIVNATQTVSVSYTITDNEGCADVFTSGNVTTTLYRSGVSSTCAVAAPSLSNQSTLSCYVLSVVSTSSCAGTTGNGTTTFGVWYFADATDNNSSTYQSQNWLASVFARDQAGSSTATTSANGVELNTIVGFDVQASTTYSFLAPNQNTGATNTVVWVKNAGNGTSTLSLNGTALTFGANAISTSSQHYASSSFSYGGGEQTLQEVATAVSGWFANIIVPRSWTSASILPAALCANSGAVVRGYLYSIGGDTDCAGSVTNAVSVARINATGSLAAWTSTTALPSPLYFHHTAPVLNDRIYVIGGGDTGTLTSTILVGAPNASGSIPSWSTTTPLSSPRASHIALFSGNYLYAISGGDSTTTATSSVLFGAVSATGSVANWSSTAALPSARVRLSGAAYNGYLYVLGGINLSLESTSTVLYARVNSTGSLGAWTETTRLPYTIERPGVVADSGILYVYGGAETNNAGRTSTVIFAPIESNGSLGPWSLATSMSATGHIFGYAANNGYLYRIGGVNSGGGTLDSVYYAPIGSRNTYFGISVPGGTATGTYTGINTFTAGWAP